MTASTNNINDWRLDLFGSMIQQNHVLPGPDVESPAVLVPTDESLSTDLYDYVAVFFGANYCPHCREFAPVVVKAGSAFEAARCKVLFCSNDRDNENFVQSCLKTRGIDVIPYDTNKTSRMRDLFGLKTIPALLVFPNKNVDGNIPAPLVNARNILPDDPTLQHFPWTTDEATSTSSSQGSAQSNSTSVWERFLVQGDHGKWYNLGHRRVTNASSSGHSKASNQMYMDEHAVRIRAGILNIISWMALLNIVVFRELTVVYALYPVVAWEFIASSVFGLTPLAPIGTVATLLAILFQPVPLWKPANPKRFAWSIGLVLASVCFLTVVWFRRAGLSEDSYLYMLGTTVIMCNIFTWLESVCGFCLGCFVYNTVLVPYMDNLQECEECKL